MSTFAIRGRPLTYEQSCAWLMANVGVRLTHKAWLVNANDRARRWHNYPSYEQSGRYAARALALIAHSLCRENARLRRLGY